MSNAVVHFELWSEDPDRAAQFYTDAFGWDIRAIPGIDYLLVEANSDDGIGGGIMTPQSQWSAKMTFYIDVDDLEEARQRVVAAGGTIVVEEVEVPGVGSLSLFNDPDGRSIGLWKKG